MTDVGRPGSPRGLREAGMVRALGPAANQSWSQAWLPLCRLPAPPVPTPCCPAPLWKHLGSCGVRGFGLRMVVVAGVETGRECVSHGLLSLVHRGLEQLGRPSFSLQGPGAERGGAGGGGQGGELRGPLCGWEDGRL